MSPSPRRLLAELVALQGCDDSASDLLSIGGPEELQKIVYPDGALTVGQTGKGSGPLDLADDVWTIVHKKLNVQIRNDCSFSLKTNG